jgi:hypothetical protein
MVRYKQLRDVEPLDKTLANCLTYHAIMEVVFQPEFSKVTGGWQLCDPTFMFLWLGREGIFSRFSIELGNGLPDVFCAYQTSDRRRESRRPSNSDWARSPACKPSSAWLPPRALVGLDSRLSLEIAPTTSLA